MTATNLLSSHLPGWRVRTDKKTDTTSIEDRFGIETKLNSLPIDLSILLNQSILIQYSPIVFHLFTTVPTIFGIAKGKRCREYPYWGVPTALRDGRAHANLGKTHREWPFHDVGTK